MYSSSGCFIKDTRASVDSMILLYDDDDEAFGYKIFKIRQSRRMRRARVLVKPLVEKKN